METITKLINLTYDKIFLEGLHIVNSDIDNVKSMILEKRKLFNSKINKELFISGLKEKIKQEKITEIERQQRDYGEVIMNDYEKIITLYNWLYEDNFKDVKKKKNEVVWIGDEETLKKIVNYLKGIFYIQGDDFYKIFTNEKLGYKVNWKSTTILLIYLFEELKNKQLINSEISINSFIEGNFLNNDCAIKNTKQSKNSCKNNKNAKPKNCEVIDKFFKEL